MIELEELKASSATFNKAKGKVFSRMGFSPRWEPEFLILVAELMGADFTTASPLSWNSKSLRDAYSFLRSWSAESNGGIEAENDFNFKYFKILRSLVLEGMLLCSYRFRRLLYHNKTSETNRLCVDIAHSCAIVEEDMLMVGTR